jgi:phasin
MESVMSASPTPQLGIPNELRAVAELRIEQAKGAFADFMRAAQGAVSALEDRFTASQASANQIGDKAMSFAERNVSSAFELAQTIVQTKDIQELVRMQTEFAQSQMNVLSEQVKDLGETVSKASTDSMKSSIMGGLSS